MTLLAAKDLSLAFGVRALLDGVSFSVEKGEKIALLGRNGEGKSSLLNVLCGTITPDSGEVVVAEGVRLAYLPQDPPPAEDKRVEEVLREGVKEVFDALALYQRLLAAAKDEDAARLLQLEDFLQANEAWSIETRMRQVLMQFELDGEAMMSSLSGGWRRRVYLARLVLARPDVLLLDEPTNHLDVVAIDWLQGFLARFTGAVIFITHDRAFMRALATRIWELDRGHLLDVVGDYARFLKTREDLDRAEEKAQARFDKRLAEEEVWIRQGIKARRTRNEGRVRQLLEMRKAHAERVARQAKVRFSLEEGVRSGRQVIVAENLCFSYDGQSLIDGFSDIVERGEKIALIGANGVGKTTLLRLLLGEIAPNQGEVRLGTQLQVAYFDQLRMQLDGERSLRDSVAEGADFLQFEGRRVHVASYLQDFLFAPARFNTPVRALSGGERARLLLARLFAQPTNVLVLDEPTNDLDVETLELLEERLLGYQGTVLLVSHDRAFVDAVATRSWVFNVARGKIEHVVGGFDDWQREGGVLADLSPSSALVQEVKEKSPSKELDNKEDRALVAPSAPKKRLSYKLQRELDALPAQIEALEERVRVLEFEVTQPVFFEASHTVQAKTFEALKDAQEELECLMERWLFLEGGA